MDYRSKSVKETQKIAADLAKDIFKKQTKNGAIIIALEGELGAGKTTFTKAFAKAMGVKKKLTSPTFVLMRQYKLDIGGFKLLIHLDTYRLRDYRDLLPLGIKEILKNPENIILIEWADRVVEILPKNSIKIHLDHISENERKISICEN